MNSTPVFDRLAQTYDVDFTTSLVGQLQRKRVQHFLTALLKKMNRPLQILEINCGTGQDALWLASLGHTVVATDASAGMITKAKEKLYQASGMPGSVSFLQCSFNELSHVLQQEQFDCVVSNFGGLNCINENALITLSNDLALLTKENSPVFFVIMAKYCAWETLYYFAKGKFKTAFRRHKSETVFTVDKSEMPVYYYAPGRIKKLFSNKFNYIDKQPVGLFIPPSYLENFFATRQHFLNRLNSWEEKYAPAICAAIADHYCISFIKTTAKK